MRWGVRKADLSASLVVFLVALPLRIGVAVCGLGPHCPEVMVATGDDMKRSPREQRQQPPSHRRRTDGVRVAPQQEDRNVQGAKPVGKVLGIEEEGAFTRSGAG